MNRKKLFKKGFATVLALATASSGVVPNVFAAETKDDENAALSVTSVETAPAQEETETEVVEEKKEPEAKPEAEESGNKETKDEQKAEGKSSEKADSKDSKDVKDDKKPAAAEKAETGKSETSEKKDEAGKEGSTAAKEEEAPETEPEAKADSEQEEPAEEKEIKKYRFRLRFDEGAGTVKVVISSDEGADKDDPSVEIKKEEGKKAEKKFRNDTVKEALVKETEDEFALDLDLSEDDKVIVYSEASEGYKVSQYTVETDAGGEKDADPSRTELSITDNTLITFGLEKEEQEEIPAQESGKVLVNLMSDGGTVTISGEEKTWVISKDEKGNVSVTEDGQKVESAEGKYAFSFDAAADKELTVTAKSEKGVITAFSIGKEGGTSFEESAFKAEDKLAEFSQKFTPSKDDAKVISVSFADMPEFKGEQKVGDAAIEVYAEKGIFPAGTTFKAVWIDIDDESNRELALEAERTAEGSAVFAVDITFYDKSGKEIQPSGMVQVTFKNIEATEKAEELAVIHVDDEKKAEAEEIKAEVKNNDIVIENDSFSPYVVLAQGSGYDDVPNPGTGGNVTHTDGPAASAVTFVSSRKIKYQDYGYNNHIINYTWVPQVTDKNHGNEKFYAYCADPYVTGVHDDDVPLTRTNVKKITNSKNILKCLYYGMVGSNHNQAAKIGGSDDAGKVIVHWAITYYVRGAGICSDMDINQWNGAANKENYKAFWQSGTNDKTREDVAKYMNYVESAAEPTNATAYIIYPNSGNNSTSNGQPYLYVAENPEVYVFVRKISADPDLTDPVVHYSLANAEFSVYDTEAHANAGGKTGLIGSAKTTQKTISTSANPNLKVGDTPAIKVGKPGTYWIREDVAPPKGFLIPSTRVKSITLTSSSTKENPAHVLFADPYVRVSLQIEKSANNPPAGAEIPSLVGTQFTVYRDEAHKDKVGVLTIGSNNMSNVLEKDLKGNYLTLGLYYVTETKTTPGYKKCADFTISAKTAPTDGTKVVKAVKKVGNDIDTVTIDIVKTSGNKTVSDQNKTVYSLEGAQFGIYDNAACSGTPVKTVITDANGKASATGLLLKNYWVKELKVPKSNAYLADTRILPASQANFGAALKQTLTFIETPRYVSLQIIKTASGYKSGEEIFPLKGTEFTVYKDSAYKTKVGVLTIGEDNTSNMLTKDMSGNPLPFGVYYVKETKTLPQYEGVAPFQIDASKPDATATQTVKYTKNVDNKVKRIEINVVKKSADEKITSGNAKYSLAGAKFEVYDNAKCEGTPVATMTTDANGKASTGKTLLVKDYWVKEANAPEAFYVNSDVTSVPQKNIEQDATETVTVPENPKTDPLHISIRKKAKGYEDNENINSLAGTEFEVRFYAGEYYKTKAELEGKTPTRTWTLKAYRVSGLGTNPTYFADFDHPDYVSGDELYIVNGKKVLPLGTVTVTEKTPAEGYLNDPDFGGGSDIYIGNIVIGENGEARTRGIVGGTDVENSKAVVTDTPKTPEIRTVAKDVATDMPISHAGSEVTIEDTVNYENFIVGNEYTIKGRLVNKADGTTIKDINGKEVTAETTFKAETINGSVKVVFTFKTDKSFEDKTVVAFETAEFNGKEIAVHADINDEAQTIHFPEVKTNAVNTETGERVVPAKEGMKITDTISYKNLIPGKTYTVKGTVMVKETGEPLGQEGSEVTAQFTPDKADGTTEITFTIDARELKNQQLVVFEELYIGTEVNDDKLVGDHKDINDKAQTVAIPDVTTDAADTTIKEKVIINGIEQDGTVSGVKYVDDEVTFSNLEAGKMYEISGELKLQNGEEDGSWSDAQTVTSEVFIVDTNGAGRLDIESHENGYEGNTVYFIPESKNGEQFVSGSIIITFKFDATGYEGKDIVVGETVTRKIKLAIHNDLQDIPQTVNIPKGETTSVDKYTDIKNSLAAENRIFKDTFKYENLEPGKEYVFTGFVVIADVDENGQTVKDENGNPVVHEIDSVMVDENGEPLADGCVKFTPEEENGTLDLYFMIDATEIPNRDVTVFEDVTRLGQNVIRHYVLDGTQTVYIPEGETEAVDTETQDHIAMPDEEVTIVDTLVFKNLIPGTEYTVTGRVMKKSDVTEVPSTLTEAAFAEEEQGTEISVEDSVVTFTPQTEDGALKLTFVFSASELKGEDTVIFERVYHNGSEVIIHENINDEPQTVHLPDGRTEAADPDTDDRTMMAKGEITIRDRFFYENLLPGYEYAVHGKVMLKPAAEGEEPTELEAKMVDAEGNEIEEWIFTPEEKDGSQDIFFVINADDLAGRSVVMFEEMEFINPELETRTVIVKHEDINDEDQTVHFPDGRTTALDSETKDHISKADTEVTIYDEVMYKNLIPGKTYTVKGTLMDKATGKAVMVNGEELTVTDEFIPAETNGSHVMTFTFDGSLLNGHTTVVYETVYSNGKEVFIHANIEDEDQTVHFPDGGTTATDNKTQDHTTYAEKNAVINDEVKYTNLIAGKEYKVTGVLMDKATEQPLLVNGKQVTADKTFTAQEPDGSVIITFKLDASQLAGKSVVAYETVTYNGKEVFVHADLKDADQTIDIPSVKTEAADKADGNKEVNPTGSVTVVDKVTYTNLTPGTKYVVKGVLMNKSTKKPAKSGGKDITGQASFKAEKKDGTVNVEFRFNASDLKTGDYVVFEELYEVNAQTGKEIIVGDHKDINDKSQTIRRPEPPTPNRRGAKTGDDTPILPWVLALTASIVGIGAAVVIRRKKTTE